MIPRSRFFLTLPDHLPLTLALALALLAQVVAYAPPPASAEGLDGGVHGRTLAPRAASSIAMTSWSEDAELATGTLVGLKVVGGTVRLTNTAPVTKKSGNRWRVGTWTSPWNQLSFGATEVIPTWEALTPGKSLIQIRIRGRDAAGVVSSWDQVATWAQSDTQVARQSAGSQPDDLGSLATDTWRTPAGVVAWQVSVSLLRKPRAKSGVRLERVGAMASAVAPHTATSDFTGRAPVVLDVPSYSQMTHRGHLPQFGGGGEAWCSPTSLAMVLGFYGLQPGPFPDVAAGHVDAQVDHTARMVYDSRYRGTGNWAFNTAYAATLTQGDAFVTRLPDLNAVHELLMAGVPVITSIAFGRGELTGAPISASNGHLLVVVGFEADGDVIVNDPAAPTNTTVRRVYDRDQFEAIWQRASGGVAFVINR